MIRYRGGQKGKKGSYWNFVNGTALDITEEGILPGDEKMRYIRVPRSALFLACPVMGMFYVIAFPFINVLATVTLVGEKILEGILRLLAPFTSFGWRPKEGHFAGKKKGRTKR